MGKILVTGGTGYLGTHMLVELVKQGYEPLCVDNLHNSNPSVLLAVKEICGKEIPFIKADAGDVAAMRALFAEYRDRRGHPLRRPQGRRRIRGAPAHVLPQQL